MKAEADLHFLQGVNQLDRPRLALHAEGSSIRRWRFFFYAAAAGVQRQEPVVDCDAGRGVDLQRFSFLMPKARQSTTSRTTSASDRRRLGAFSSPDTSAPSKPSANGSATTSCRAVLDAGFRVRTS
jgi:hypothetical protein